MIGVKKQLRLIAIPMDHLARRVVDFVMVNHFFIFDAYIDKDKTLVKVHVSIIHFLKRAQSFTQLERNVLVFT